MTIVPTIYAPLDPRETARVVADAFSAAGRRLPGAALRILLGLIWHETNGHPPGYGIGNIAAAGFVNGAEVSHWSGLAWRPPWFSEPGESATERDRLLHQEMLDGSEPSAFRAYGSLAEAVESFRALLVKRFAPMLEAALRGDLDAFAHAYRDTGYCGNCDPRVTVDSISRRITELESKGAFDGIDTGPDSGGRILPLGGGAGSGAGLVVPLVVVGALVAAVGLWLKRRAG